MRTSLAPPWALILAGGDGTRLRPLTRQIAGDQRPKQFCPLVDGDSLLDRTRRRVDLVTRLDQQVIVVTAAHEPYYRNLQRELAPGRLVVQPANRGTATGVLYPLLRIRQLAGNVPVAVFPSDHYVSDDAAFAAYTWSALGVVRSRPDLVALLGVDASTPETEYGWIEPAEPLLSVDGEGAFSIRRFWEKPGVAMAQRLLERGALWNSFVMVGHVDTFLRLVWDAAPDLVIALDPLRRALGTDHEATVAGTVYATLRPLSFSERVLVPRPERLVVVRVKGVEWSDWGNPQRVLATVHRAGWQPGWLERVRLAPAG